MEPKNGGFQVNQFKLWDGSIHSQKMSNNATAMPEIRANEMAPSVQRQQKTVGSATACQPGKG